MLRRVHARALTILTVGVALAATLAVSPAAAGEPQDIAHLCEVVGHNCGSTVDHADGQIIARHYGIDIGRTLDAADVDRILDLASRTRVRASSGSVQSATVGYAALAPLCPVALHGCGSTVDDGDVRVIAGFYGLGVGSSVDDEDVQRVHATATHRYSTWDRIAQCEASGNWRSTVGLYEGGLQFHPSTWDSYKPRGYPSAAYHASREQQILVAERVLARQGWGAWPSCSRKLGLR